MAAPRWLSRWMPHRSARHRSSCTSIVSFPTPALLIVYASASRHTVRCPACGHFSRRVHSPYSRSLADLPGTDFTPAGFLLTPRS